MSQQPTNLNLPDPGAPVTDPRTGTWSQATQGWLRMLAGVLGKWSAAWLELTGAALTPANGALYAGDAAWTALTYQNSWVDFGAPRATGAYRKLPDGQVQLRGTAKNGSAVNTVIATLPAGYRPAASEEWACVSNGAFGWFTVENSGAITGQAGSTTSFALNCTFYAEG